MIRARQILIPVVLVALGVGGALALRAVGPKPAKTRAPDAVPTVEVVDAKSAPAVAQIRATGLVVPAQQVVLSSEVNARVIELSSSLLPGGRLAKGALVARLDSRDFQLAVKQEQGRVRQAEVELQLERGRNTVAAQEWKLLRDGAPEDGAALALRQPQLVAAQENLEAAKSGLARAQLNLGRTVLRAPFNAMVIAKQVDVGQLVGPTATIATLIGTDEVWVDVSVPLSQLRAIDIPGINATVGSPARVSLRLGGGSPLVREGRVLRLKSELDDKSRTARLLVAVADPFAPELGEIPLLPGAYVEVTIAGKTIDSAFRVPREALTDGDRVWTVDSEERLREQRITIAWREPDHVVVTAGLTGGERIVVSPLRLRAEGMPVRTQEATVNDVAQTELPKPTEAL